MIGLHFFVEGYTKLTDPKPFSAPFFGSARGPFAGPYKAMVWDADGLFRLDREGTLAHWDRYRSQVIRHYGFEEGQVKKADQALKTYEDRLKTFLGEKRDEIEEYRQWIGRRNANARLPERELASLQAHDAKIQAEMRKLYADLVPPIDGLWKDLENDLNAIATVDQWKRHGRLAIGKPGRRLLDSETMDRFMPYFDLGIGLCLLLGLLTRPAAILGAAFLASVILSRFPPEAGPASTFYHAVEMVALLVLAAIGAGRYLGLDYFFGGLKAWCCPPKTQGEKQ